MPTFEGPNGGKVIDFVHLLVLNAVHLRIYDHTVQQICNGNISTDQWWYYYYYKQYFFLLSKITKEGLKLLKIIKETKFLRTHIVYKLKNRYQCKRMEKKYQIKFYKQYEIVCVIYMVYILMSKNLLLKLFSTTVL